MADRESDRHPDLEALAAFAAERLEAAQAAEVAKHAETCPSCRLELKRLRRFAAIDEDASTQEEAGWPVAERALERAFRERILPESLPSAWRAGARARRPRLRWPRLWLVPAAATAVLAVIVLSLARRNGPDLPGRGVGPMRGRPGAERLIVPVAPVGLQPKAPERFVWSASESFDSFALEILTPELDVVFQRAGLADTTFAVSDSLRTVLSSGRTYLWSVQGYRGLTASHSSSHAWFAVPAASR